AEHEAPARAGLSRALRHPGQLHDAGDEAGGRPPGPAVGGAVAAVTVADPGHERLRARRRGAADALRPAQQAAGLLQVAAREVQQRELALEAGAGIARTGDHEL